MKQCTKCKQILDESMFNKRKDTKDGLRTECRTCQCNYNKTYYETFEGKQKHLEYMNDHKKQYQEFEKNYSNKRKELYRLNILDRYITLNLCHSIRKPNTFNLISQYLNFTYEDFILHLEKQFIGQMCWSNYGSYWEIDHIIPKQKLKYNSPEDKNFKICWSLTNLRPLSIIENRSRPKDGRDIPENIIQNIMNGV